MAIKKGICKNYGECDLADEHKIQEVDSADFVCEECGRPLFEEGIKTTPPTSGLLKKILIGVGCAAVLGGGTYALLGTGSDTPKAIKTEKITLSKSNGVLTIGSNDTLHVTIMPKEASPLLQWASNNTNVLTVNNGIVTAVGEGTALIGVQVQDNKEIKAFCKYTVKSNNDTQEPPTKQETNKKGEQQTSGNVTDMAVANGKYTGPIKNGKPHGLGTLVFTKSAVINNSDVKKRTAKPGESVQGQFVNGNFTIGKHYDAKGNLIESLNFGVAN